MNKNWFVYMLECRDGSFYTGITTDIKRRLHEHNHARLGAKYTRSRRPVKLVYKHVCQNRSDAGKAEHQIRKLARIGKLQLIGEYIKAQKD